MKPLRPLWELFFGWVGLTLLDAWEWLSILLSFLFLAAILAAGLWILGYWG